MPANGTTLATQAIYTYNGTTEVLTFNHTDASATAAQETAASGALVGNTTYNRTAEYTPLGRNIADAGLYITLNTGEPVESGGGGSGVNLFGVGGGYRPGRATYKIDGLTVPQVMFMEVINSGAIGGAFGLLEMSARMSARPPQRIGYWRRTTTWDETDEKGNISVHTEERNIGNVYADDSWSLDWSLLPAEKAQQPQTQQQRSGSEFFAFGFNKDEYNQINKQVKFMGENGDCGRAFQAAGLTLVYEMATKGNLIFVHNNSIQTGDNNKYWAGNEDLRKQITGAFAEVVRRGGLTADVTPTKAINGNHYVFLSAYAFDDTIDTVPKVIIHALAHAGGAEGKGDPIEYILRLPAVGTEFASRRPKHDLEWMNYKNNSELQYTGVYDGIIKACLPK